MGKRELQTQEKRTTMEAEPGGGERQGGTTPTGRQIDREFELEFERGRGRERGRRGGRGRKQRGKGRERERERESY